MKTTFVAPKHVAGSMYKLTCNKGVPSGVSVVPCTLAGSCATVLYETIKREDPFQRPGLHKLELTGRLVAAYDKRQRERLAQEEARRQELARERQTVLDFVRKSVYTGSDSGVQVSSPPATTSQPLEQYKHRAEPPAIITMTSGTRAKLG